MAARQALHDTSDRLAETYSPAIGFSRTVWNIRLYRPTGGVRERTASRYWPERCRDRRQI